MTSADFYLPLGPGRDTTHPEGDREMNIKQHIEAGHYPVDEKGRALVPVGSGQAATICATDAPGDKPILGFIRSNDEGNTCAWCMWDEYGNNHPHQPGACWVDLRPPPPRKVLKRAWVLFNSRGEPFNVFDHRYEPSPGMRLVEMTGEYEEPWLEEPR